MGIRRVAIGGRGIPDLHLLKPRGVKALGALRDAITWGWMVPGMRPHNTREASPSVT